MIQQYVFEFALENHATDLGYRNDVKIARGQIAFLSYLLTAKNRTGSLDDVTADLTQRFADDGKWRGSITLKLSLDDIIKHSGVVRSSRLSRNAGLLHRWRLVNPCRAKKRIDTLKQWLESIKNPCLVAAKHGQSETSDAPLRSKGGSDDK